MLKEMVNKENALELLKQTLLVLRAFCLFFIPQSIDSSEKLYSLSDEKLDESELNVAEMYASLWDKSAELLPPFRRMFASLTASTDHHDHSFAVKHASLSLNALMFIAMVCFTEILKACQYAVLDKVIATKKFISKTMRNTQHALLLLCVFFYNKKRNTQCTSYA